MSYPTKIYQGQIADELRRVYPLPVPIETEWRAITNKRGLYCPRIDVAVGPFAEGRQCIEEYDRLMDASLAFIQRLLRCHCTNVRRFGGSPSSVTFQALKDRNRNARCLLAIEIENRVSRKHMLGGAVNAAALGRLGVVVGWTEDKARAFVQLREYWDFLASVGKNTFDTTNLLILSPLQLDEAVADVDDGSRSRSSP